MAKKKKILQRANNLFSRVTFATGLSLIAYSYYVYKFMDSGFVHSVNSDIFGIGLIMLLVGIIYTIFKIKVS